MATTAKKLYEDLQENGVSCFFAPEDMKVGDKIRDRIDESIRFYDKLLVILSENSINSEWVEDECETAYEEERKRGRTVLFPVQIDYAVEDTHRAWAAKLRNSRHIGDFTLFWSGMYPESLRKLQVDKSQDSQARDEAVAILDNVEAEAFIVAEWSAATPLKYMLIVEGRRPDVQVFDWGLYGIGRLAYYRDNRLPRAAARRFIARDDVTASCRPTARDPDDLI